MKVSGFTIIRNAVLMDYPVVESIKSLLPLVDEMIVGVGQSDDSTKELIASINDPKILIFDAFWDTQRTQGGLILSEKTNEALARCKNDLCFYLQGDEVLSEREIPLIRSAFARAQASPEIDGILFGYHHFYGSYDAVARSRRWYRNEIRVIKKSSGAVSVADAQGFRIRRDGHLEKLRVIQSGAHVFHYGWVKPPESMRRKKKLLDRWWHGERLDQKNETFDFEKLYGLSAFRGEHPAVMKARIARQDWVFDYTRRLNDWTLKDLNLLASDIFERTFKYRIGEYKPYRLVKESIDGKEKN